MALYLLRGRLRSLVNPLHLFTPNNPIVDVLITDQRLDISTDKTDVIKAAEKDSSTMKAIQQAYSDKVSLDGQPPTNIDDEGIIEIDEVWKFGNDESSEDVDDLSFNERFELLLEEKDFAFARELLDFAHYNEINDERYHCERLHLFEKMGDEDGFYKYYYQIESKLPTYPQSLQTQISKYVVQLANR